MTETPVKRDQLEAGDITRWADGVHGPSRGVVLVEESTTVKGVVIAMDTLSESKPLVLVLAEDFIVEEPDKVAETPEPPAAQPQQPQQQ